MMMPLARIMLVQELGKGLTVRLSRIFAIPKNPNHKINHKNKKKPTSHSIPVYHHSQEGTIDIPQVHHENGR